MGAGEAHRRLGQPLRQQFRGGAAVPPRQPVRRGRPQAARGGRGAKLLAAEEAASTGRRFKRLAGALAAALIVAFCAVGAAIYPWRESNAEALAALQAQARPRRLGPRPISSGRWRRGGPRRGREAAASLPRRRPPRRRPARQEAEADAAEEGAREEASTRSAACRGGAARLLSGQALAAEARPPAGRPDHRHLDRLFREVARRRGRLDPWRSRAFLPTSAMPADSLSRLPGHRADAGNNTGVDTKLHRRAPSAFVVRAPFGGADPVGRAGRIRGRDALARSAGGPGLTVTIAWTDRTLRLADRTGRVIARWPTPPASFWAGGGRYALRRGGRRRAWRRRFSPTAPGQLWVGAGGNGAIAAGCRRRPRRREDRRHHGRSRHGADHRRLWSRQDRRARAVAVRFGLPGGGAGARR